MTFKSASLSAVILWNNNSRPGARRLQETTHKHTHIYTTCRRMDCYKTDCEYIRLRFSVWIPTSVIFKISHLFQGFWGNWSYDVECASTICERSTLCTRRSLATWAATTLMHIFIPTMVDCGSAIYYASFTVSTLVLLCLTYSLLKCCGSTNERYTL